MIYYTNTDRTTISTYVAYYAQIYGLFYASYHRRNTLRIYAVLRLRYVNFFSITTVLSYLHFLFFMYTCTHICIYVMHVVVATGVYVYVYICSYVVRSYFLALSSIATLSQVYAQYAFLIGVSVNYWNANDFKL